MMFGPKIFHKIFAPASLGFILAGAALAPGQIFAAEATATTAVKRQAAATQFNKAEEQRATLNSKAAEKRSLGEYKQVVASYRRVALITPRAPEVPDSLLAVAELYVEMGDRFGKSYYQSAVESYQFLVREYPTSRYGQDAMLRSAKLLKDQVGDPAQATSAYQDFLKKYPKSSRKREAQEALAELALLQNGAQESAAADASTSKTAATTGVTTRVVSEESQPVRNASHSGGRLSERSDAANAPRLRRISTVANGDSTRITIDLEDSVQYMSARISNPDRIFFDLHAARLTPELARGNIKVEGNLLTGVRVAQNQAGVVRVVLDVNGVKDYTASLSNNPAQLIIDLYGTNAAKEAIRTASTGKTKRAQKQSQDSDGDDETVAEVKTPEKAQVQQVAKKQPVDAGKPSNTVVTNSTNDTNSNGAIGGSVGTNTAPPVARNSGPGAKPASSKSAKAVSGRSKPDLIVPSTSPQPTRDGGSTLTRALGLKIGRIVIDAGHGGHDTGTIGPTGLMEKDLCLDVALRLGKIIQQRLPGADVVYTRSDDTFIPLEERTNIANQAKADLFISIHANSSQDHAARGIETYYLNMKGSAEAMEVAARENAASQEGIHDLQDLVKKIARTEKIDESREFAEDIQDSLSKRIQRVSGNIKNRGVRKAPFVVLIGADMPSILTEISFLSNPADEQLLKKPEQRQRVAEGLYQGVSSYLQSMNSVALNLPAKKSPGKASSAPVEESRNQQ